MNHNHTHQPAPRDGAFSYPEENVSDYDDGFCCTPDSGDCRGPGSWCCKRAGKHDHDEEGLETFADRMARRSIDAVQHDSWKAKQ